MSEEISLGGGCFWCIEAVFAQLRGVQQVESGYSNGAAPTTSYEDVCTGTTGAVEVIKLRFDPDVISLRDLLAVFFAVHDPTTPNRQGNDVGTQYRSGIYTTSAAQAAIAHAVIAQQQTQYAAPIVTEVLPLAHYRSAEDYHQNFFAKNPRQPYCLAVALPKMQKVRQHFAHLT